MRSGPDLVPLVRRGAVVTSMIGLGLWPAVLVGPVSETFARDSWSAAVNALSLLALAGVAYKGCGVPLASTIPRWERFALAAVTMALPVDVAIRARQLHDDLNASSAILPLVLLAVTVAVVVDRYRTVPARSTPLTWPLGPGVWQVAEGTGRLLNHHWAAPAQRGALDILGCAPDGRSHRRLVAKDLSDYAIYGMPVLAPCGGTVIRKVDGLPDHPSPHAGPAGNHLVIDNGSERVVLAHLACGSVTPVEGGRVTEGQAVGRVGSSGNSTEPHLHIHAVRDGHALTLDFREAPGPFRRGYRIRVTHRKAARQDSNDL